MLLWKHAAPYFGAAFFCERSRRKVVSHGATRTFVSCKYKCPASARLDEAHCENEAALGALALRLALHVAISLRFLATLLAALVLAALLLAALVLATLLLAALVLATLLLAALLMLLVLLLILTLLMLRVIPVLLILVAILIH